MPLLKLTSCSLSGKQFLAQKWITEMEHPSYSFYLTPNDFWPFPKIMLCREEDFRILKTSKKCDDGTENYSTTKRLKAKLSLCFN
jgi:hypothetical protein